MAKNLESKKDLIESTYKELQNEKKSISTLVFDYSTLKANEINTLRNTLFANKSSLKVMKNTLIKILLDKFNIKLDSELEGQNAVLIDKGDFITSVKHIAKFIKDNKKGVFKIGILENTVLSKERIEALATIPSKEILISKLLSSFNYPLTGFITSLNGVQSKFVRVLNEIKNKK